MKNSAEIVNELKAISPFWECLQRDNLYTVPVGYFDQLVGDIHSKILLVEAKTSTLQIPSGYFDNLSDAILAKITAANNECNEELKGVAPLLNTISKENIFTIPSGYFENFSVQINKKKQAKFVALRGFRKWVSYAAAAIIAGVLVTGGFLYSNHNSSSYVINEIKKVSDEELNSYVKDHVVALSDEAIDLRGDAAHVKESLKLSTDAELQQYLNENAETYSEVTLKTD